ncbi:MAG: ABC transporter permease subunit [Chitinophagaceae bacterium]|nr:ABC transporter permease subunit [Chitinophagaceae bacterium]
MFNLVSIELYKISRKPRSFIGFAAIAVIALLIELALFLDGKAYVQFIIQQVEQSFQIEGNIINGNLVAYILLQTLIVQMPLLVALVGGDLLSGEAATGSIRLLAAKPVSRANIILSKFAAGSFYTMLLICWLGVLALGMGWLLFGRGDLIVVNSDHIAILQSSDTVWRFVAAFFIAFISLSVVTSLSLMLSCFSDNSIGPIMITMAIIILFTIIGTMEIPLFDLVRPFLFTTHMIVWRSMFEEPLPIQQLIISIGVMVLHIFLFLGIALSYFKKKDLLS